MVEPLIKFIAQKTHKKRESTLHHFNKKFHDLFWNTEMRQWKDGAMLENTRLNCNFRIAEFLKFLKCVRKEDMTKWRINQATTDLAAQTQEEGFREKNSNKIGRGRRYMKWGRSWDVTQRFSAPDAVSVSFRLVGSRYHWDFEVFSCFQVWQRSASIA